MPFSESAGQLLALSRVIYVLLQQEVGLVSFFFMMMGFFGLNC